MIDRIDEQPTPDEEHLRRIGVYHNRRRGKDRRRGSTVLYPSKDRRNGERRKQKTVHIATNKTATFVCPECKKAKIVDVSDYIKLDNKIWVNAKCPCGNEFRAFLNKRKQFRKETNLKGTYSNISQGNQVSVRDMKVYDLSRTGMKLKLNTDNNLSIGDILSVEFFLDDIHRSFIKRTVIVKNTRPPIIGVEFRPEEDIGKAIGFYLYFN
jgi:ribosomal protein L37AE/L43A